MGSEQLGLLFSDGSMLVLPEDTTVEIAREEAEDHDQGESSTRIVRLKIEIVEII